MKPTIRGIFRSTVVVALAAVLMIGNANATSANTDVTDLWWNKNRSGSGYQFVNTGTFVFATAYVYGVTRQPFWISAHLTKTSASQITYTGPVYVTTGPYYGGPYDTYNFRQAGTMTFVLTAVSAGQLTYSIDGVVVNEPLERQPLTLDFYGGSYSGILTITNTNCLNPVANGSFTVALGMDIAQAGTQMTQVWRFAGGGSCTYQGTYSQEGRMGRYFSPAGASTCTPLAAGDTLTMFEMANQPYMFTSRVFVTNSISGCVSNAEYVGVIPR